jgi:hypothetical protein
VNASAAQLAVGDGTAYARGRRLQAAQTAGFIQKNVKAITVKHDVTVGVTNAVTESVTATPAETVDHWVTAGVTEAVTETVTRVALVWQ